MAKEEFKIVLMTIKDADNPSNLLWKVENWDVSNDEEIPVQFPKEMLSLKAISREIVFFSAKAIEKFKIVQTMSLEGHGVIERMDFDFGFVIPGSTNSWDQTIEADVGEVMPAEVLSGNLVVDTLFLSNEDKVLAHTKYRVYYV